MIRPGEMEQLRDVEYSTEVSQDHHFLGMREILVLTDLTRKNRKAIIYAATLARPCNAHVTLLHVYREPCSLEYMRGPHVGEARERQRLCTQNALELFGKEAREQYANCSTDFRDGILCDEIANAVKELDADLLIIGSHGNKWFRRMAYGSDADAIVRLAPCPVLVVR